MMTTFQCVQKRFWGKYSPRELKMIKSYASIATTSRDWIADLNAYISPIKLSETLPVYDKSMIKLFRENLYDSP